MGTLFKKRFDMGCVCDVTEDFTLPDYQPEIRRVLGVRARAATDGKYLTGEEIEVDGGVTYTVIYVGADGGLYQASETSSYTGKMPASSENDRFGVSDLVLSATTENVTCRVSAPRRMTLSSRVKLSVLSQRPVSAEMKAEGEVRRRAEKVESAHLSEIRHTAEIDGEIREGEGLTLVLAGGEVCISDVRLSGESCKVKGDAYVNLTLLASDGEYVSVRKSVPVEEDVILPDGVRGEVSRAVAYAMPLVLEVESSENGEITWKMEYDIDVDVLGVTEADVTLDAYLTESEDEVKFSECDSYYPASCVNGRLTTTASVRARGNMKPVTAWGCASFDRCEISSGRMTLTGQGKLYAVMAGDGDIVCEEVAFPLRYECEAYSGTAEADDSSMVRRASVTVCDVGMRRDGDNVNLTAELAISVAALGTRRVRYVSELLPIGDTEASGDTDASFDGCVIRIYAPSEGENSWDVEKRFRLRGAAESEGEYYII